MAPVVEMETFFAGHQANSSVTVPRHQADDGSVAVSGHQSDSPVAVSGHQSDSSVAVPDHQSDSSVVVSDPIDLCSDQVVDLIGLSEDIVDDQNQQEVVLIDDQELNEMSALELQTHNANLQSSYILESGQLKSWPPSEILTTEKIHSERLLKLYKPGSVPASDFDSFVIGGEPRDICAFHFQDTEGPSGQVRFAFRERSYFESDNFVLYRWETISAFVTCLQSGGRGSSRDERVFYSMCKLQHAVHRDRFFLLQILMTLCKDFRMDFLVYDTKSNSVVLLTDTTFIKSCWCLPSAYISQEYYENLLQARFRYFDR